jgi:hypothetical protein
MSRPEPDRTFRFVCLRQSDARSKTREADGRSRAAGLPRGELDAVTRGAHAGTGPEGGVPC